MSSYQWEFVNLLGERVENPGPTRPLDFVYLGYGTLSFQGVFQIHDRR